MPSTAHALALALAPAPESAAERLTWAEVCRRHPDQWVVLADTEWVDASTFEFTATRVVGYGRRRSDAIARARAALDRYRRSGCFYTGKTRAPHL